MNYTMDSTQTDIGKFLESFLMAIFITKDNFLAVKDKEKAS